MMSKPTVLIVEDEHALASALGASAVRLGTVPRYVSSGMQAVEAIAEEVPAAIVLDIGLPDMNGLSVLRRAFPEGSDLPVLVLTAHGNLENAIAAKRLGVAEYLTKPLDLHSFENVLKGLLNRSRSEPPERDKNSPDIAIVGSSQVMQRVFRDVAHACMTDRPVMVRGASGTGKTLLVRAIHKNAERAGSLSSIECGDSEATEITKLLSESEDRRDNVLMENIDRLSEPSQTALLAALESGDVPRLFSTTRSSLQDAVDAGEFREDLYYRLRRQEIMLPALDERTEDIPELAAHFVELFAGNRSLGISDEALEILAGRSWRGNVRELADAIRYAVTVCGGDQLLPVHLPPDPYDAGDQPQAKLEGVVSAWVEARLATGEGEPCYADLIDEIERIVLRKLLARHDGKPTLLASELGINRTTLRKRLERLGLS